MLADILTMRDHTDKPLEPRRLLLSRRRPEQHRQLAAGDRRPARHGRAASPRPRTLWPTTEVQTIAARAGRRVGGSAHHRRRRGRRRSKERTSSTPTSGCRWANRSRNGRTGSTQLLPLPGQRRQLHEGDRATRTAKFMHCLPALHNRETEIGQTDLRDDSASRRPRGHRRSLRVAGLRRLRPSREPAPHHQGGHGRHARATDVRLVVAVGGNALLERGEVPRRRDPGEARPSRRRRPGPARPRPRPGGHPRQRPPGGSAGQRERLRPGPARIPTPSTSSAPKPRG